MRKFLTTVLLCFFAVVATAQTSKQFDKVRKITLNSVGVIKEMDNMVGYYAFYQFDKADSKNDIFKLELLDENLSSVKSIDVLQPRGSVLLECVFNGKAFMLVFTKKNDITLVSYDKSGKKLGDMHYDDLSKWEKARLAAALQSEEGVTNASVFPVGSDGFIRQSFTKNDKVGYTLECYDNNLKVKWSIASDPKSNQIEAVDILYSSDTYIIGGVGKKKSMMSGDNNLFAIVGDAKAGKKLFEIPMKDGNSELSLVNAFVNEQTGNMGFVGEYFAPGDDYVKGKSRGLYVMIVDKAGTRLNMSKISWDGDVKKFVQNLGEDDGKDKDLPRMYIHSIYRNASGGIVAVGEQFRKTASGLGIASKVLNGGNSSASTAALRVMAMTVLELDQDYKLKDFRVIEKKSTLVNLPAGAQYMSPAAIALYVKYTGGFDYNFSSSNKERDSYYSVYQDYDRKGTDGKKSDMMLGVIKYEDGKLSNERFPINTSATRIWIQPAKPGYINITEYNKKQKSLKSRIEKVSYL